MPCGPVADPMFTPVADLLVACLHEQIQRVASPPAVVCLRPGDRVDLLLSTNEDECCRGLAWVRRSTSYPSRAFPDPDQTVQRCSPTQWAAVFELGAARCAPRPPAQRLPSCDEWTAVTRAVDDDYAAIRRAVCCYAEQRPDDLYLIGQEQPLTTEGGCVGTTLTVTVAVPACDCEESE